MHAVPKMMLRRFLFLLSALASLLLAGCASTVIVRSEVVAHHAQPFKAAGQSYAFAQTEQQRTDPEYAHVTSLVAEQLQRLGFVRADPAQLQIALAYRATARDVRVFESQIVDPWYGSPWYGPAWGPFGFAPYYADPIWRAPPLTVPVERRFVVYSRELKITMLRPGDAQAFYEVAVHSEGADPSLAAVMPAMVRSAFADFPGPSGVPRVVEMPRDAQP